MQRANLGFVFLVSILGFSLAVETVKPSPDGGELLVNDFTQSKSTTRNALGYSVFSEAGMEMTYPDGNDPRAVLTPKTTSSFFYSFLRQPGQCFDGSNFDYISLELKTETDLSFLVGFGTNPAHCDEAEESVMRYSLVRIAYNATGQKRSVVDIPISSLPGNALKTNMNAIMLGGSLTPIEVYSVKLKAAGQNVNESTIARDSIEASSDAGQGSDAVNLDSVHEESTPESDNTSSVALVVEDFATDDVNVNALGGTHRSDNTMPQETYTTDQGVLLTSSSASSYWYTVIPCTSTLTFKYYEMLLLDVVGPEGGDFGIRLKTRVQCDAVFKEFVYKASDLLQVKLNGKLQHVVIPFDMMAGFDKKIHTIESVVIGDFQNKGETHNNATPMSLNVKSVSIRGNNINGNDDEDKMQERIPAKEKENSADDLKEDRDDPHSGASQSAISILAIVSAALLLVL